MREVDDADEALGPPKKKIGRMGECEVCTSGVEARYRCPGCRIVYCSTACFKEHRSVSGCSGKRDKTAYVPLEGMTDSHMLSDYTLLEDALRRKDSGYRTLRAVGSLERHPFRVQALISRAADRGTTLALMPEGMTRRRTNSTTYDRRSDTIFWKVEFCFDKGGCVVAERADEHTAVSNVLAALLADPVVRHGLCKESALDQPLTALRFLLIDCDSPGHAQKHFELDGSQPLKMALAGKRILEHPQIRVLLPTEADKFAIIAPPPPLPTAAVAPAIATETTVR